MNSETNVLVFDYGASSGRGILFRYDDKGMQMTEVHRFANSPRFIGEEFCWDIDTLFSELKIGISKASKLVGKIDSIGIDTWGVDFVMLDAGGNRIGNSVHYRDKRSQGMSEKLSQIMPSKERYELTGIAQMQFNTLYQLYSIMDTGLDTSKVKDILFIPDYFGYLLTGKKVTEWSIASTGEVLSAGKMEFCAEIKAKLPLIERFRPIVKAGTTLGMLSSGIKSELGLSYDIPVITVCAHDTASAVMAVPSTVERFAYISSGTWSLLGTELSAPILSEQAQKNAFTNEIGYDGSVRFLSNIMGMWIIQQCRSEWAQLGIDISYAEIAQKAKEYTAEVGLIDVNDQSFIKPKSMLSNIKSCLEKHGYKANDDIGYIAKCVYLSLSLEYEVAITNLQDITKVEFDRLYIVGGGSNNALLNQMTANAIGKTVVAGVSEATAVGNALCQLLNLGKIHSLSEGRKVVGANFDAIEYAPSGVASRIDEYKGLKSLAK